MTALEGKTKPPHWVGGFKDDLQPEPGIRGSRAPSLTAVRRSLGIFGGQATAPARKCVLAFAFGAWACLAACTPNEPPIASAGADRTVFSGERVVLEGSGSDADGSVRSYRWEQVSGWAVLVKGTAEGVAEFKAPVVDAPVELRFLLTVTDGMGASHGDEVAVMVKPYEGIVLRLSGTVRNSADYAPIEGARLTVSQHTSVPRFLGTAETDAGGTFSLDLPTESERLIVKAVANGFATQSTVVSVPSAEGDATTHVSMVPVQAVKTFTAADGINVQVEDRTVLSLPGHALATESGNAYEGSAVVSATVLDPSRNPSSMPGDFMRWDADSGTAGPIESYGALNVLLATDDGEPLQLADGVRAPISIPLAQKQSAADAPLTVPLYFWSDEAGYWIKDGQAKLEENPVGAWAYVGTVGHFTTWNADVAYDSVGLTGCVADESGNPLGGAKITAQGIDFAGTSSARSSRDGRFSINVRPDSELQLAAIAGGFSSDAVAVTSGGEDSELDECVVVLGERGLEDFETYIEGDSESIEICVRDHECEDGDAIGVAVEGRTVFAGEIENEWACQHLEVKANRSYEIEMTAMNGTGYKGACNFADVNTGQIRVAGKNVQTQVWRHRGGAGSRARIVVALDERQPFTIVTTPPDATVSFVGLERAYKAGMPLRAGEYRMRIAADGHESREVTTTHGSKQPTTVTVTLDRSLQRESEAVTPANRNSGGDENRRVEARLQVGRCQYERRVRYDPSVGKQIVVRYYAPAFSFGEATWTLVGNDGSAWRAKENYYTFRGKHYNRDITGVDHWDRFLEELEQTYERSFREALERNGVDVHPAAQRHLCNLGELKSWARAEAVVRMRERHMEFDSRTEEVQLVPIDWLPPGGKRL